MFIRIVTIKCPNERAKKAFKLLNKEVTEEQMKVGLVKQTTIDTSKTTIDIYQNEVETKLFDIKSNIMIDESIFKIQKYIN